ncbi:hypothetical protein GXW83_14490 [Streptacidiphilus sp. PB12-B1b]|uniref:G1 family glutamic endopeptidase n=1 Tax=Streptacidiphilus sp. PB12-B1b TaxID=2705012 RepID=UPI0015FC3577|nr:G1 family glutamic endopeptidase [Streptacidiphilus sp. PB12-B1b]QMU76767.1 hypothetical protein GXW83_14490 [Streptacidiphilus sp. PB12-B1b]
MRRALRNLAMAAAVLASTALVGAQTPLAAAATTATTAASVTVHATRGCAGAVVRAPRAGQAMTAADAGAPSALDGFFAKAAEHHVTWLTAMTCTTSTVNHRLQPVAAAHGTANTVYQSGNWSGYQITQPGVQVAQAGWTIPAVTVPSPGYSSNGAYYSSTWSGVGGGFNSGSGALVQAGTSSDISVGGTAQYYPWWEIVNGTGDTGGEVRITNLAVHAGDTVSSTPYWAPINGGLAQFAVCNMTQNVCVDFAHASSAPGTTAEWIQEAPTVNGSVASVPNFGSLTFTTACWVQTWPGSCVPAATGGSLASIDLYLNALNSEQLVSYPGAVSASGSQFTVYYRQP